MNEHHDYIRINRESWNNRVDIHLQSDFYDMKGFRSGKSTLMDIELELLGNIKGKKILHLQCHFGQDSISLARMGASVTGVDLSDKAIETAKKLTEELNEDCRFICCDVYSLPEHLNETFDIVFTSYGTIGWLPNLNQWASVVSKYLKSDGLFVIAEFHPVVWMFDNDFKQVSYKYFKSEPIVEHETGTYADPNSKIEVHSIGWNHSISEVINALIENNLSIKRFNEFDYSPYNCFKKTIEFAPGKYRIQHLKDFIPLVYAIKAIKE